MRTSSPLAGRETGGANVLVGLDGALSVAPKMFEERPPGGASTREVGRSVSTLPAFWFEPDANAFALVPFFIMGAVDTAVTLSL